MAGDVAKMNGVISVMDVFNSVEAPIARNIPTKECIIVICKQEYQRLHTSILREIPKSLFAVDLIHDSASGQRGNTDFPHSLRL